MREATKKVRSKKRKQWCNEWLKKRNKFTHINPLNELRHEPWDLNDLLSIAFTLIKKKYTQMTAAIHPNEMRD